MASISFRSKRGLIKHGFKDIAIRQKKESDHWFGLSKDQDLKVYWKMRSSDKEILKETKVREAPFLLEIDEFDHELVDRAGFNSVKDLKETMEDKYGEDYAEHKYVVIIWEV